MGPGDTHAGDVAAVARLDVDAAGRAQVPGGVVPGAAAKHPPRLIAVAQPSRSVTGFTTVVLVPGRQPLILLLAAIEAVRRLSSQAQVEFGLGHDRPEKCRLNRLLSSRYHVPAWHSSALPAPEAEVQPSIKQRRPKCD